MTAEGSARSLPLVGRAADLATLIHSYEQHGAGGYFVAIEGEAGIGKTRLAEEFLAHARARGATAITVRCFEGEAAVAYGPIADGLRAALRDASCAERTAAIPAHWLSEAARLLPELLASHPELPSPLPVDALGGQSRFFEALRQVLMSFCRGPAPNVLFFDDIHWADSASLDLLAYLVRRLHGQPLFLLATWQGEDPTHRQRLARLVVDAQRGHAGMAMRLARLKPADVLDLLRAAGDSGRIAARRDRQPAVSRDGGPAVVPGRLPRSTGAGQWSRRGRGGVAGATWGSGPLAGSAGFSG